MLKEDAQRRCEIGVMDAVMNNCLTDPKMSHWLPDAMMNHRLTDPGMSHLWVDAMMNH